MDFDYLLDESFRFLNRFADGDTSRKIRDKRFIPCITLLDNDGVTQMSHFQPACLRILFRVPLGMVSPVFPSTVTRIHGFFGWSNLRLLTLFQASNHPY